MSFTGTAAIKKISDGQFRITGLSLGIGAAGTISLSQGNGEVKITAPGWGEYKTSGVHGGNVGLNEAVTCEVEYADAAAATTEPIAVVNTSDDPVNFLITLTNRDAAVSGALVLVVRFHG